MYFMIFLQYSIMILQYSSITIHQKESIDRMSEIKWNNILQKKKKKKKKKRKEKNSKNKLTNVEITLLTGALGKINWVSGMSRLEISYQVWKLVSESEMQTLSPKSSNILSRKQIYKWRRSINFHQLVMFSFNSKHRKILNLVNNWFMFHGLEKFGLVKNFIKRIKILLTNQESCIINGWKAFKYLKLKEGARQGDPISAYLFILVL